MDALTGETDLAGLLRGLDPRMDGNEYAFCTFGAEVALPVQVTWWAHIKEDEGSTLILPVEQARSLGLSFDGPFKRICLHVHSSLHAVGLTAAVSQMLARHRISANMVSGYYHDHLFVPQPDAEEALRLLRDLQEEWNHVR